jgi:hypothetical protein
MDHMKILINSYPRSGTTTLVDAIRVSVLSDELQFGEDFFHNEQWISKSHLPVLFFGSFPSDIVIGTILRDPVDAISSNCFRWANGHTGNIVQGKIVIDKSRESKENKFDETLKNLIIHQVKQYISYYSCLISNPKDVLMFEYSEIQNDTKKVIDRAVKAAGGNISSLNYHSAEGIIKNPPQPTKEKTELYYRIREYISSLEETNECYSLYYKLLKIKGEKYE